MLTELFWVGSDPKLAYTAGSNPTPVLRLNLAYDVGFGEKKHTQWVDASLWGARAESLEGKIVKGDRLMAHLSDVMVDTWQGTDGQSRATLRGKIVDFSFAGGGSQQAVSAPAAAPAAAPRRTGGLGRMPADYPPAQAKNSVAPDSPYDGFDADLGF